VKTRSWASGFAVALLLASCSKRAEPPAVPPLQQPRPAQAQGQAQSPADRPSGNWLIRELRLTLQADPPQRLAGVDEESVRAQLQAALLQAGPVRGVGVQSGVPRRDQLGLALEIGWQRLDDRGQPQPLQSPGDGQLLVVAVAHAESPGAKPSQSEVAEHTRRALLPLSGETEDWPAWLLPRLERVAVAAAIEVMGELWAREAQEADLIARLDSPEWWQVAAAAREIGERRLQAPRPRLEKLCRDSRRDVAVVAVSALGRLGGEQSLATLAGLVDHAPAEVVDAALVALSLLKSPAATALLQEIAQGDDAEVSLRAKQLLGSPADLPGKATSF
jgi:hypothetical protein